MAASKVMIVQSNNANKFKARRAGSVPKVMLSPKATNSTNAQTIDAIMSSPNQSMTTMA